MKIRTWLPLVMLAFAAACSDSGLTGPDSSSSTFLDPSAGPEVAQPSPPAVAHFSVAPAGSGTGPTVTTDKEDYAPGETVTISGSGWWAGETVELRLDEEPATHDPLVFSSVADENGDFVNRDFVVGDHDVGVTFTLTATGLTSGLVATTGFTDGNFNIISSPASLFSSVTYDRFNSSGSCSGTPNSTNQTLNYGTNLGLNAGQSMRFTPPTVTGYTYSSYSASASDLVVTALSGGRLCVSGFATTPPGSPTRVLTLNYTATNRPPTADAGGPYTGDEGSAIQLDGSGSSDPDGGALTYSWTVDTPSLCTFDDATKVDAQVTCTDNGSFTLTLTVTDAGGLSDSDNASLTVNNVAPVVSIDHPVHMSVWPITGISGVTNFIDASFTDAGTNDTHTCLIAWGNSSSTVGTVAETSGAGTCRLTPSGNPYASTGAGIYTITVTVTDDDGGAGSATVTIVVYDPSAGFVTGGGWIDSPAGAYKPDLALMGKATFGFVSKYKKGATRPDGNTEFQFHAAGMNFHSANYDWLVVNQAGTNAQFKGTGTINGSGNYGFMLWAVDGSPDKFRIRIWEEIASVEVDVYDNGFNQPIGGGSIVIHTGSKK